MLRWQVSQHYELMNYSEHGTTVDNVLYSCDFSEKSLTPAGSALSRLRRGGPESPGQSPDGDQEVPPLIQRVREVVGKRRGLPTEEQPLEAAKETMPASIGKVSLRSSSLYSVNFRVGLSPPLVVQPE